MTMREWILMPPPGAQLVFWQDGSLRLRFPEDKADDMIAWAESMGNAMRVMYDMQRAMAEKKAREQPVVEVVPALPQTDTASVRKVSAGVGVPSINDHMQKLGIKRQAKAQQDAPKPMQARPAVVKGPPEVVPAFVGARPQPELPEAPPDLPKGMSPPVEEAPPDLPNGMAPVGDEDEVNQTPVDPSGD